MLGPPAVVQGEAPHPKPSPPPNPANPPHPQNDFLASSRAAALESERCSVVIGNEASDLDSVVSSITYARLLQEKAGPGEPISALP